MSDKIVCRNCGNAFNRPIQKGRPPVRCESCRAGGVYIPPPPKLKVTTETQEEITVATDAAVSTKRKKSEEFFPHPFILMVGNLGQAYGGDVEKVAVSEFNRYANLSTQGYGQVGRQAVQLWKLNTSMNTYVLINDFDPNKELK